MTGALRQNVGNAVQTLSATTCTITVPAAGVLKGSFLLVRIGYFLNAGVAPTSIVVSDSKGNGWNFAQQNSSGEGTPTMQALTFWSRMAVGALVAGDSITITFNTAVTGIVMSADEFTGMRTATATADGGSANTVGAASTTPTATLTNTGGAQNDVWTGFVLTNGPSSDAYTEDPAWTTGVQTAIATMTMNTAYDVAPFPSATRTYAPTLGTARIWVEQISAWATIPVDPVRFNPIPFVAPGRI